MRFGTTRTRFGVLAVIFLLVNLACNFPLSGGQPTPTLYNILPEATENVDIPQEDWIQWQISPGGYPASIGDLNADLLQVTIPDGAYSADAALNIGKRADSPPALAEQIALFDQPLEISGGEPTRLMLPAEVQFRVDDLDQYGEELASNGVWVAYFNGTEWEYFPPKSVDPAAGTLTFETYHFCLFGYGKVSVEERLENYTHSKTLSDMIQSNVVDESVNQLVDQAVSNLLTEQLGLADDSVSKEVIQALVTDDAYSDLVRDFKDGKVTDFSAKLNVMLGQKIVENVDPGILSGVLGNLASDTGVSFAASAGQAAGYMAEGQYKEAAKILGEQIADQFLITQAAKIAVEVVQYEIDTWKNAEVEAAYQAYKNGASDGFWGYNVDSQDFGQVWSQMKGVAVRLQSEAVTQEINRRSEMGMPPATEAQLDAIRNDVEADLKEKFESRLAQEAAIAEREAQVAQLIGAIRAANLLEYSRFGFDRDHDTIETRLDKLMHLADKILRDTGRKGWVQGAFSTEETISIDHMTQLMQAWYLDKDGTAYAEQLEKLFGITQEPVCYWEMYEISDAIGNATGNDASYAGTNGTDQIDTIYAHAGGEGCSEQYFMTTHTWTQPGDVLHPGEQLDFTVAAEWWLDGSASCTGLTAGVSTFINFGNSSIKASDSHIAVNVNPSGSVSNSGTWTVFSGSSEGATMSIYANGQTGGLGGSVYYKYQYVCEGP